MDKDEAKASAQGNSADQTKLQDEVESGSITGHSIKSLHSARSSHSSADQEMELKLEKVRLETRLDILQQEKEANAALVKAEVMEAAAAEIEFHGSFRDLQSIPLQSTSQQRVSEYITKHVDINLTEKETDNFNSEFHIKHESKPQRSKPGRFESTPAFTSKQLQAVPSSTTT